MGEASFLNTGYAVYAHAVQSRLHDSGKYDVAEFACYGTENDPRRHELPWKYFWNEPPKADWGRLGYNPDSIHQFGAWRLNDVLIQYRPDIVWDVRDQWMLEHEERSPFRRFFRWAIMPTVDAMPQSEAWLSTFMDADAVLTYSDWGMETLDREGGGLIRTRGSAPPAADRDMFRPMDRAALRRKFAFTDDVFIVGTIMRNQPRKLYPQLIRDFAIFLREAPEEVARKTFLYLHTSYPDKEGWDLPCLIKQSGISHKILVTYRCLRCHAVFCSFFQDARAACVKCGSVSATTPNSSNGIDQDSLAHIINLFDVYVQYANSEGFGMPQVEAACCGVPVMATDYSAMSDIVRKLRGWPIPVAALEVEPVSNCLRARPDGRSFVRMLSRYFAMPEPLRAKMKQRTRDLAVAHYDWDKTAARWMEVFDSLAPVPDPWSSPPRLHTPALPQATFASNEDFVDYCIRHVLGRPEMVNSYMATRLVRDLNWGSSTRGSGGTYRNENAMIDRYRDLRPFTGDDAIQELVTLCQQYNDWETKRWQLTRPDSAS